MATVRNERPAEGIARLAIDRPDKRNAINAEARRAMIAAVEDALADETVRALVLGSQDGHFCAGGDIDSMAGLDAMSGRARMKENNRLTRLLAEAEKPVVTAIEGYAVGGGAGLALLADTIVIAEGGSIGFPFFGVGLIPDYGILHTLPRRVGAAKARQLLLYARRVTAADAVAMGLADELTATGGAEARALELAEDLAAMPPHAFALAKRQLGLFPASLDAALEMEAMGQSLAFTAAEFAEGRAAFQEKRKPRFR